MPVNSVFGDSWTPRRPIGTTFIAAIGAFVAVSSAQALARKPTAMEVAAIASCAAKYRDDVSEGERQCVFKLVADPCTNSHDGHSNQGEADCYRIEMAIWDDLLNENFNTLRENLDGDQKASLRDLQRAWIAYRDTTCGFYREKIQGSMAVPMASACFASETARRALLLNYFKRL